MDMKKELKLSDLLPSRLVPKGLSLKRKPGADVPKSRRSMPSQIVGLKIESTSLTAAQVTNNGGKSLVRIAQAPLASGIMNGGEVRDPAALGSALAEFFASNGLPHRGVRLGVGNSRIGVRVIEVGGIGDRAQLENAIGFRAHEILSVPLDEAVIDYHLLGTGVDSEGGVTRRILLVVAYRESIDRYLAATDAAGLEVVGIDLEAFALLRAAAEPRRDGDEPEAALVVVSVDHEHTTLAISDGRDCHFSRVLEWGAANVDRSVARTLRITATEAAEIRNGLSLVDDPASLEPPSDQTSAARQVVRHELQTLVRELQSSLRFYESQPGSLPIGVVLVSGGLADVPGLAAELGSQLGLKIEVADPFTRVRTNESVERPEHLGELTVAVGLGIED